MASASDTSGMEFEVFLSFRGPDTRDHFTSCLYSDMVEKGIRVFKDDEELRVGQKIGGSLLGALDNTQIYIPIFSKGFASSPWCLREVAHMVDCTSRSDGKKEILPIFFDVKPDDVKLKTELYRNALSEYLGKYGPDEVKRWEDALKEVPTRVGWRLEGQGYGELIKLIVREVLLKLKLKTRSLPDKLVEMDDEKGIEELLKVDAADHVRFIIIHGTGGIGKTTLASVIFNRFRSKFDGYSFLEDVQDLSQRHGLLHVQKKLLFDTLGSTSVDGIHDTNDGINRIRNGLRNKKVLVVVDNVNEKKQFENLVGSYTWFGSGSRILVTVRDRRTIPDGDKQMRPSYYIEYPVKEMPLDRAIELFSKHAFRSNTPPKDWHNFSKEVVSSIGRLPLTLEVVGSLFARTVRSKWEKTLNELKQVPPRNVRDTLMISIKKLDCREKAIFLDIACYCIGEQKTNACYMWEDCGYSPHSTVEDLLLMSLIKIDEFDFFQMHDELRDLGRYIVKEENFEDAEKRRWMWIDGNTLDILRSKEEKQAVRALSMGISHDFTPEELALLPMLKFIGGKSLNFVGDFKNLLYSLRWLSWRYCPLNFSAMNLHPVNLVVLNLSRSKITDDWGGWRQIEMAKKLKVLDLSYCLELTKTPDFTEFGNLEELILVECRELSLIDSSIGKLKMLTTLNMEGCHSLQGLPEEIGSLECLSEIIMPHDPYRFKLPETLGNLKSLTKLICPPCINQLPHSIGRLNLTHLILSHCENLHKLPNSIGELESLVQLDLQYSAISVLPNSIGRLKNLKHLLLSNCENLHELPKSIGKLESLVELDLKFSGIFILPDSFGKLTSLMYLSFWGCINLHQLPDSIGKLKALVKLNLEFSSISVLPDSIGELKALVKLNLRFLAISVLPDSIGRLKNLKHLLLDGCKNLHKLPESIWDLESLVELDLKWISILPDSFGKLTSLTNLFFSGCKNLLQLPDSIGELKALVKLDLEFSGISVLPDSIGRLKNLKHLLLSECKNLHGLPESIGELKSLVELDLKLSGISILPNSIGKLMSLTHLFFSGCKNLLQLPDSIGELKALVELDLKYSGISVLPDSIGKLKNLKRLLLSECKNLHGLPESIGELESLVELDLKLSGISLLPDSIGKLTSLKHLCFSICENLLQLPDSIGELKALVELDLKYSGIFALPDSIGRLKNLEHLLLFGCKNLRELPESIEELESLVGLDLKFSGISILPDSIGRLMSFTHLSFNGCENLLQLPNSIGELKTLVTLDLNLSGISVLPNSIGRLKNLKYLILSKCKNLHELPDSIGELESLEVLNVAYTKIHTIPCALGRVETLDELNASFCPHLVDEIPWEMWSLTRLRILDLDGSPISTVPRKISGFRSLQTLKLASHRLFPLPELPLSLECIVVAAAEFPILPDLSSLVHLHYLEVRKEQPRMTFLSPNQFISPWKDAQSIHQLPPSLSTLKLQSIPRLPNISNFQSLLVLSISQCLMPRLPDLSRLKRLQELRLSDFPELAEIPGLGELESLEFLHISMCDVIKQLPNLSKLKNLLHLELKHCAKLRAVEGLKELESLENVEIRYCMSLERLPDVRASTKLETNWMPPEPAEHTIQPEKQLRLSVD